MFPYHFLKIHINIFLPYNPRSYKWPPSLRSAHQHSVRTSPVPHTWRMGRPAHSSWFGDPNNIWWEVQIVKLPYYLIHLRPNCSVYVSPQCEEPSFIPIENNKQNYIYLYYNLYFWIANRREHYQQINLLTPNVNYSGRTAPLTSKVAFYIFIQQI